MIPGCYNCLGHWVGPKSDCCRASVLVLREAAFEILYYEHELSETDEPRCAVCNRVVPNKAAEAAGGEPC